MDPGKERELVERARTGDEEAFRELVESSHRQVYALALRYTNHHADADEIAQEAFLRAYRGLGRFRGDASFGTWIFRITVNCCYSHSRQRREPAEANLAEGADSNIADEQNPSPFRKALSTQTRREIKAALGRLSPKQRLVFVMKFLQHKSLAEIAEESGCAVGTVKKQLFRAVGRMREALAPLLEVKGY